MLTSGTTCLRLRAPLAQIFVSQICLTSPILSSSSNGFVTFVQISSILFFTVLIIKVTIAKTSHLNIFTDSAPTPVQSLSQHACGAACLCVPFTINCLIFPNDKSLSIPSRHVKRQFFLHKHGFSQKYFTLKGAKMTTTITTTKQRKRPKRPK